MNAKTKVMDRPLVTDRAIRFFIGTVCAGFAALAIGAAVERVEPGRNFDTMAASPPVEETPHVGVPGE